MKKKIVGFSATGKTPIAAVNGVASKLETNLSDKFIVSVSVSNWGKVGADYSATALVSYEDVDDEIKEDDTISNSARHSIPLHFRRLR